MVHRFTSSCRFATATTAPGPGGYRPVDPVAIWAICGLGAMAHARIQNALSNFDQHGFHMANKDLFSENFLVFVYVPAHKKQSEGADDPN